MTPDEMGVSELGQRLSRRLDGWPSLADRRLAERLSVRPERVLRGPRVLAGDVAQRFATPTSWRGAGAPLPLALVMGRFATPVAWTAVQAPPPLIVAASWPERTAAHEPSAAMPPVVLAADEAAPTTLPLVTARPASGVESDAPAFTPSPPPALPMPPGRPFAAARSEGKAARADTEIAAATSAPMPSRSPAAPGGTAATSAPAKAEAPEALTVRRLPVPPAPVVRPHEDASVQPEPVLSLPQSGLARAILQRARLATAASSLAGVAGRGERWRPALRRTGPEALGARHLVGVAPPLPVAFAARRGSAAATSGSSPPVRAVGGVEPVQLRAGEGRLALEPPTLPSAAAGIEVLTLGPLARRAAAPATMPSALAGSASPVPPRAPELVLAAAPRREAPPAPEPVVAGDQTGFDLPTVEAGGRAPAIDPRRLADQVYDLLVHRLGHERARRGW